MLFWESKLIHKLRGKSKSYFYSKYIRQPIRSFGSFLTVYFLIFWTLYGFKKIKIWDSKVVSYYEIVYLNSRLSELVFGFIDSSLFFV